MDENKVLTTGGSDPFLPHLLRAINKSTEIDIAVSFIMKTGLNLIKDALIDAITPSEITGKPRATLRILTTNYLNITDPKALRLLMLFKERGAEIRIYESTNESFHMKAYIFLKQNRQSLPDCEAFIGSSNISGSALTTGLEWNYKVTCPPTASDEQRNSFTHIKNEFESLFKHKNVISLSNDWIDNYERNRPEKTVSIIPGDNEVESPPTPTAIQLEALQALTKTREEKFRRGLVVLATGLGKTWLAAFDSQQIKAKRILFVAHREEILMQAEQTFLRIYPHFTVGYYTGKTKDKHVDILCASVQTLGKEQHLERFPNNHFDYVIVDEFHHAAAQTYRNLIHHFKPRFLLGLTATPERTDQSDILSLCDDNLVFTRNLFSGIESELLSPFHYYGIFDEEVNYEEIPWRNSKFDPSLLSNKLATLARAKHAKKQWQQRAQSKTLAFCVSIKHAEFMADKFNEWGIKSAAVYGGSKTNRTEGLEQLNNGELAVIFSVDLFNEGVDLPSIDTVMMLRPTESKVLFLQQLGRGLRKHKNKTHLIVLDFIGNHHGFLNKPQALFNLGSTHKALAKFAKEVENETLDLPNGCFVNYDLKIIDFLKDLDPNDISEQYQSLKASLNRRPTLTEFYRSGVNLKKLRLQFGSWWHLVADEQDLTTSESNCFNQHQEFYKEVENAEMSKSFKMVLLESLLENQGFINYPTIVQLAKQAFDIFSRRRQLITDIKPSLQDLENVSPSSWLSYWRGNPIKAWLGENKKTAAKKWFINIDDIFQPTFDITTAEHESFCNMVQELVDFRFVQYQARDKKITPATNNVIPLLSDNELISLPFFPNIKIACGHFKTGFADAEEYKQLSPLYGHLDPNKHFIAQASGDSMNGGKNPVKDGDYLLLERISATSAGSITGQTMAIERIDETGDGQYLLRVIKKDNKGQYSLHANNPDYADITDVEGLKTFARLKNIISPLDLVCGQSLMREDIPPLFGVEFNPGNWQSGHVVLNEQKE